MCEYRHYINTEGRAKVRIHISITITQKYFPVFARVRTQAPHVFVQKLIPQEFFPACIGFVPGGNACFAVLSGDHSLILGGEIFTPRIWRLWFAIFLPFSWGNESVREFNHCNSCREGWRGYKGESRLNMVVQDNYRNSESWGPNPARTTAKLPELRSQNNPSGLQSFYPGKAQHVIQKQTTIHDS